MDYTPISSRRVLTAFALTAFVALLPALYFALQSGTGGHVSLPDANGSFRGVVLGAASVVLTASLIGVLILTVALARRMVRRPSRA
jgi:hypothetical protein